MGRTIIEGYTKLAVARQVTALALDKGWKPVSKITMQESFMHDGRASYICVMEKDGEEIYGTNKYQIKPRKRKGKIKQNNF